MSKKDQHNRLTDNKVGRRPANNKSSNKSSSLATMRETIWQWVNAIPPGRVATYGQLAKLAGSPERSRFVGRILSELPKGTTLPWYRVINSAGEITNPNAAEQASRLRADGVRVTSGKRISLRRYQWTP